MASEFQPSLRRDSATVLTRTDMAGRDRVPSSGLEWAVVLYVASTVVESAAFSLGSARVSRLIAVVLVLVVVGYATSHRIPRFFNVPFVCILGIFLTVAASTLWTEDFAQTTSRIVTFGGLAVASGALAAALALLQMRGVERIKQGLIMGAAVASVLVIEARIRNDFFTGPNEFTVFYERSTAGAANPNDLALLLAIALPACLWSKRWQIRYTVAPLTVVAILFTGSRGAVISLAVGATAAALIVVLTRRRPLRILAQSSALAAAILWVAWILLPEPLKDRIAGIPTEVSAGSFTNRSTLWQAAWQQFSADPFWGTGAGTADETIYRWTGRGQVVHNTHLSFLVELGMVGWLLFIVALLFAWAGAIRWARTIGWPLVSMAVLSSGTWALSWEYNKLLWVMLVLGGALISALHLSAPSGAKSSTRRREM